MHCIRRVQKLANEKISDHEIARHPSLKGLNLTPGKVSIMRCVYICRTQCSSTRRKPAYVSMCNSSASWFYQSLVAAAGRAMFRYATTQLPSVRTSPFLLCASSPTAPLVSRTGVPLIDHGPRTPSSRRRQVDLVGTPTGALAAALGN